MRIPGRAQLLRFLRAALCVGAVAAVLLSAELFCASAHAAVTRSASQTTVRVGRGDTLSGIAARYGVSEAQLRRWNHLRGSDIRIGQLLAVAEPHTTAASSGAPSRATAARSAARATARVYRVRPGNTLGAIADRYGVSIEDLRRWNGLRGSIVRVGQVLRIAGPGGASGSSATAAPEEARASTAAASQPARSRTYRVRSGDTLSAIAGRYGVSETDLRRWNHLRGSEIRIGQQLSVSGPSEAGERREAVYRGRRIVRRRIYRVRRGDTLSGIADRYGVSEVELRRWNRLRGSYIRIGQRLVVEERTVYRHRRLTARELARSRRLERAFVASSQLRPMAQQLATTRSPSAYAGVAAYARAHTGDAAAAAYLAQGHAYLLDHRYTDAVAAFERSEQASPILADFAAFLTAQAYLGNNDFTNAETVLTTFTSKFPDSIFVPRIPVLEADAYIQQKNGQAALAVLNAHLSDPIANHSDFQLALAQAYQLAGNASEAQQIYTHVYLDFPLSAEATQARAQLAATGALDSMPASQRRRRADALFDAGRYTDAEIEYRSLARNPSFNDAERNSMLVAAAACQWKLHTLTLGELNRLPDTNDAAGARRLQLMMELARDRGDTAAQQSLVTELATRFPNSPWLADALESSGNMYLLRNDAPNAIRYYSELAERFPNSSMAPLAHWHAAWLTYRSGNIPQAAQLMDAQIALYPDSPEIAAALYWRARIYDGPGHNPGMAVKYYRKVARVYTHYYYAGLARKRLAAMGFAAPSPATGALDDPPSGAASSAMPDPPAGSAAASPDAPSPLDAIQPAEIPDLTDDVPEQDPHLVAARLLANAELNEFISPEIQAAEGSEQWGSLAEAEIYASYGEPWRALHFMKRAVPFYITAPIDSMPMAYWRILFPTPYWAVIKQAAAANNLDPYMVASLIRQESEFNPGAVSYADAYGLMQLLPGVGRDMARQLGMRDFRTRDLLDPDINIRLGCRYLREMLDATGGQPEYAFAAYNAGANRVAQWKAEGPYTGMDEFVASIPFTQTRNYVQAIVRNEALYRELASVH